MENMKLVLRKSKTNLPYEFVDDRGNIYLTPTLISICLGVKKTSSTVKLINRHYQELKSREYIICADKDGIKIELEISNEFSDKEIKGYKKGFNEKTVCRTYFLNEAGVRYLAMLARSANAPQARESMIYESMKLKNQISLPSIKDLDAQIIKYKEVTKLKLQQKIIDVVDDLGFDSDVLYTIYYRLYSAIDSGAKQFLPPPALKNNNELYYASEIALEIKSHRSFVGLMADYLALKSKEAEDLYVKKVPEYVMTKSGKQLISVYAYTAKGAEILKHFYAFRTQRPKNEVILPTDDKHQTTVQQFILYLNDRNKDLAVEYAKYLKKLFYADSA